MGNETMVCRGVLRVAVAMALVSLLAAGICASAANAAPLSMTFTASRANVGVQLSDYPLFEAPNTAPFEAQIGPGGESITEGKLQVPQFATHITTPINADVTVDFEIGVIKGTFNQATGALSLEGEADGTLTSEGKECAVSTDPSPLVLTTAGNNGGANPHSGAPFTSGLTGPGAIAGQWTDMHAAPIGGDTTFCSDVEGQIEGLGGVWLEQAGHVVHPPPPPPPATCVVPDVIGKKLGAAKKVIRAAGCTIGRVTKPKHRRGRRRGPLVVKSSNPSAGTTLKAGSEVDLRLGHRKPKPQRARR